MHECCDIRSIVFVFRVQYMRVCIIKLYCVVLYYIISYDAILCYTMLYNIVIKYTVQFPISRKSLSSLMRVLVRVVEASLLGISTYQRKEDIIETYSFAAVILLKLSWNRLRTNVALNESLISNNLSVFTEAISLNNPFFANCWQFNNFNN